MPIRDIKVLDKNNNPTKDAEGNFIVTTEKFNKHFIANTIEESEHLLKEYDKDIGFLANKLSAITGVDRADLCQEGIIGLARAKRDFELERSEKFRIFAIFKIKDAMREFITTQASNVRVPQYVKNAATLTGSLQKALEKADGLKRLTFVDIWMASEYYKDNPPENKKSLMEDVAEIRQSIQNLADRSHTSVIQLLERAELSPAFSPEIIYTNLDSIAIINDSAFSNVVFVEEIKESLPEKDYDLLYRHYVGGETLRDLSGPFGVTAETLCVRIQNLKDSLVKKYGARIKHENNTNIKEIKQGDSG
ncbi:hypothetical protein LCGC14_1661210 [marine sediment metagenome]|uniref:RNA polymerase sigma-70 region 2 domain-containing protein n=1 Tax=marine sediment metagenome TaxID=412755 RepID=A0A0F9IGG2_9ZZZZ